ncbi:putative permease YjgP/YjgQ [Chondrocystis sp. NIES-4102]|nr:putative permease YjgP/YjgQ [Chondrocystis sp. NIES-4102]
MNLEFLRIKKLLVWRLSLLDRYIINQLSLFFLFNVGLLSSLGVAIGTVSDLAFKITEYNLPISVALMIFGYKIPEYVAYALPISLLLSSLIIYGRLSSDRELVALLSFGISFNRLIAPALALSLIITGITFLLNELIVPAANYQANLLQTSYITKTELNLQKQDIFYAEYQPALIPNTPLKLKTIYFAEQYYFPYLRKVTIISFVKGKIKQIITAQLASWNQQQQLWELSKVKIITLSNSFKKINSTQFEHQQLTFDKTIFEIAFLQRSPEDMNIQQAKEYLNLIQDSGKPKEIAKFAVRIQQKYAFPFICLIFTIIGSALGAKYTQINRSKGFGLCVAIVFIYYLLGFTCGSFGIAGIISPIEAAWLPNGLGMVIGIYLLITVNFHT